MKQYVYQRWSWEGGAVQDLFSQQCTKKVCCLMQLEPGEVESYTPPLTPLLLYRYSKQLVTSALGPRPSLERGIPKQVDQLSL
eukprot:5401816-Karenia_brevis.AAC.1